MEEKLDRQVLALARWTLERWCADQPWREGGPELPSTQDRPVDGLFVTLRRQGELRGCIGTVTPQPSLDAALRETAVKAASSDPRFPPLEAEELASVRIAVSVLTPPTALSDPDEIEVGRDGLIIELGTRKGLLLPEVAREQGWERERFLDELCAKAFLPAGAWRDRSARLYRFRSEQVSEDALSAPPSDLPG